MIIPLDWNCGSSEELVEVSSHLGRVEVGLIVSSEGNELFGTTE